MWLAGAASLEKKPKIPPKSKDGEDLKIVPSETSIKKEAVMDLPENRMEELELKLKFLTEKYEVLENTTCLLQKRINEKAVFEKYWQNLAMYVAFCQKIGRCSYTQSIHELPWLLG